MSDINQSVTPPSAARKKLWLTLAVNWLLPIAVYWVLHRFKISDAAALAAAGAIPFLRTAVLLAWRRRVDWFGVLGAAGFLAAMLIVLLAGGSALPLKLYHPAITGAAGFLLIGSVAIGKPLLLYILKSSRTNAPDGFEKQEVRKRLSSRTAFLGFVLLAEAFSHIVMALTLPTATYLYLSKVVTIGMLALLYFILRRSIQNNR